MAIGAIELKIWSNSSPVGEAEATHSPPSFFDGQLFDEPRQTDQPPPPAANWMASVPLLLITCLATILAMGVWEPSLHYQPSLVGMLWGGTYLAGYLVGSLGRGKLWSAAVAVVVGWVTLAAFEQLTELGAADCLLLTALNLLAGWATAWLDPVAGPPPSASAPERGYCVSRQSPTSGRLRWTIWEIAFATAIVACLSHAWPRLKAPPELMWAVVAALLAGLIVCWLACRWVWKDDWSLLGLASVAFLLVASVTVLVLSAPAGQSLGHCLLWLLRGPVNVVSAQGLCVLATVGVWRQCQPSLPGLPGA